jgi:hypothetical protein
LRSAYCETDHYELHKWFHDSSEADLRYDVKLQNTWIDMIRRAGVRSLAMLEEINGCPHEEGVDYPVGEACPLCPFWAHRSRPLEKPNATAETAIAFYKKEQGVPNNGAARAQLAALKAQSHGR